jgi:hypothetical protein
MLAVLVAFAQGGDYYAVKVGLRWTYSNGEVQEILGTRTVNGKAVLVLTHSSGGRPAQEDFLQATQEGVLLLGSRAGEKLTWYDKPLTVYPASPLENGKRWSTSARTADGSTVALSGRVLGSEGVATQAGRFNAFVIRTTVVTSSGASSLTDSYFVPAIGVVRFVSQDGSKVDLTSRQ